jgi:hypothetical protein
VDTLPFGAFFRAKGVSVGDEWLRRNERISPRLGKTEHGVRRVGPRPATVIYCGWRRAATRRASLDSAMARGSDMESSGGPGPINNARSFI